MRSHRSKVGLAFLAGVRPDWEVLKAETSTASGADKRKEVVLKTSRVGAQLCSKFSHMRDRPRKCGSFLAASLLYCETRRNSGVSKLYEGCSQCHQFRALTLPQCLLLLEGLCKTLTNSTSGTRSSGLPTRMGKSVTIHSGVGVGRNALLIMLLAIASHQKTGRTTACSQPTREGSNAFVAPPAQLCSISKKKRLNAARMAVIRHTVTLASSTRPRHHYRSRNLPDPRHSSHSALADSIVSRAPSAFNSRGVYSLAPTGCSSTALQVNNVAVQPARKQLVSAARVASTALQPVLVYIWMIILRVAQFVSPSPLEMKLGRRLVVASILGMVIGLERRTSHRPAGVRTM